MSIIICGRFAESDIIPLMENDKSSRNRQMVRYNLIGMAVNFLLCVAKFIIGTAARSNAVVLDGINSLSDLISSFFIIVFSRLSEKRADKDHPFGYGRLEYMCSVLITALIMFIGVRSIIEAVKNINSPPQEPDYSVVVVVIMSLSLIVKVVFGRFMKKKGEELKSESMIMNGADNLSDAYVAASVLFSIIIYRAFHAVIENWLCIVISLLILKTGVQMLKESMNKILGAPADSEFRKKIARMIAMEEGVYNVSSLIIHNYGENNCIGSVDIEVDEDMKASQIGDLSRRLKEKAAELGLTLTSVGVSGTKLNPQADRIWDRIIETAMGHKQIRRVQSFTVDFRKQKITFAVIHDHGCSNKEEDIEKLKEELEKLFPKMKFEISSAINA